MGEKSNINLPHHIQMMLDGSLPPPPIAKLIGFNLVSIGSGKAVIEFEATERHANPMGTLHGGVLCDVGDAAMGMAYASTLNEGETFTTLELKINFLKPVWRAKLRPKPASSRQAKLLAWSCVTCLTKRSGSLPERAVHV